VFLQSLLPAPRAALAVIALFGAVGAAHAQDDGKMLPSTVCKAVYPGGNDHLQHNGSSLQAIGADVSVVCPIVRDSIGGAMKWVDVRYLRPNGDSTKVSGRVYSCDATYGGCNQSALSQSSASNQFTSVHIDSAGMPHNGDRYFYYRGVLPEGWKIVAVEYLEGDH